MPARRALLIFALTLCACRGSERHGEMRLTERDLVRDNKIQIGMTQDAVQKKLQRPQMSLSNTVAGKAVAEWQYVSVRQAWVPPGNDDTGVFRSHPSEVVVTTKPSADLLFIDGTLVAIGNHTSGTFSASDAVRGDPIQEKELERFRQKFYGKGQ